MVSKKNSGVVTKKPPYTAIVIMVSVLCCIVLTVGALTLFGVIARFTRFFGLFMPSQAVVDDAMFWKTLLFRK